MKTLGGEIFLTVHLKIRTGFFATIMFTYTAALRAFLRNGVFMHVCVKERERV